MTGYNTRDHSLIRPPAEQAGHVEASTGLGAAYGSALKHLLGSDRRGPQQSSRARDVQPEAKNSRGWSSVQSLSKAGTTAKAHTSAPQCTTSHGR